MTTVDQRPPEVLGHAAPEVPADWMAALRYFATGRTSRAMRLLADSPELVAGLAEIDGTAPELERAWILGVAGAMGQLEATEITPKRAYFLARLDLILGPYEENALLSAA